jgi:hypothetical protein
VVLFLIIPERTRGFPIRQLLDPWDAPDVLEEFEGRPDFEARWRGFLRDCAPLVISRLSPEIAQFAGQCLVVADAFDSGRADRKAVIAMREEVGHFHHTNRNSRSASEWAGLTTVSQLLWTLSDGRWHEYAWYYLQDLDAVGVPESEWFPLLLKRFEGLVSGPANPA